MAIYDDNGTAKTEIGKVYDNDGTTGYQIGKVYDNNGTTDSLVYEAEINLLTTGSWTTAKVPNAGAYYKSWTANSDYVQIINYDSGDAYSGVNNTPIDMDSITKLVVKIDSLTNSHGASQFGFVTSAANTAYNSWNICYAMNNYGVGTHTIDVSALSGTYYFKMYFFAGKSNTYGECKFSIITVY